MKSRVIILGISLILASSIGSAPPPDYYSPTNIDAEKTVDNTTFINANNILMFVTNHGNFGRDLVGYFGYDYGTFYPYVSVDEIINGTRTNSPLYGAGLWVGGKVNNQTRVTVSQYGSEYTPGPMSGGTYIPNNDLFKVYKLYSDSLAGNANDDYINWPYDQGAPYNQYYWPDMIGEQMLWSVFNDADPARHWQNPGSTTPLGIEIKQRVWASNAEGSIEIPPPDELPVTHIGPSDGAVYAIVTDHTLLTGHDYMVVFEEHPVLGSTWDLIDVTLGITILDNQENQSADAQSPIVDGVRIRVDGKRLGVGGWEIPNGARRFTWVNSNGFNWEGFYGALGWAGPGDTRGFGEHEPVPALSLPRVLLKLAPATADGTFDTNEENVSYAYRYLRAPGPPAQPQFAPYIVDTDPPGGSYGFQDFTKSCPLSAWNIDVDPPRRLTVGYLENNSEFGLVDGKYWPYYSGDLSSLGTDNTALYGPREWLWIYLDDYSETPNPAYMLNAIQDPMPVMYWATWSRRIDEAWPGNDEFLILPNIQYHNTPADTFYFTGAQYDPIFTGPDGLIINLEYKIFNKGSNEIRDCYISLWTDPDLGYAIDDMVGCDTSLNTIYCYNATDEDAHYGFGTPAIGFRFLYGPLVPSPGDTAVFGYDRIPEYRNLGMTAANFFINGTDPNSAQESYNYMQGLYSDGDPYYYNGTPLAYMYSGDPINGTGDIDLYPSDKRIMGSCGPFDFLPGDSQYVWIRMAVGQGADNLTSITSMKQILESPIVYNPSHWVSKIYPDTQYAFYSFAVNPVPVTILISNEGIDPLDDLDITSLKINETIDPLSVEILPSHPEFAGPVVQILVSMPQFLDSYGLIWGDESREYRVSGETISGDSFLIKGLVAIIGHKAGDANGDGVVNVGDAVFMVNYVFKDGPGPHVLQSGDANGDGRLNIGDAVYLVNYLFRGGNEPHFPE